jgi:hypothetical protein
VFQAAHQPVTRVRGWVIHVIATLLQRAKTSGRWRAVLKDFEDTLDGVLSDPDACKLLHQHRTCRRFCFWAGIFSNKQIQFCSDTNPDLMLCKLL